MARLFIVMASRSSVVDERFAGHEDGVGRSEEVGEHLRFTRTPAGPLLRPSGPAPCRPARERATAVPEGRSVHCGLTSGLFREGGAGGPIRDRNASGRPDLV